MRRFGMYLYALFASAYIFTMGYIFKKNRKLVSNMCELFGYQNIREMLDPEIRTAISAVGVADIVDDAEPVQLREMAWTDGNVSLFELAVISKLVRKFKPKKIFEIGTFNGRTTLNLASNSPDDAAIYTLDLPKAGKLARGSSALPIDASFIDKAETGSRFRGADCEKKIIQLYGDSAAFDFSPYENSIDLIFIDGGHTYEYVMKDTEKAVKLLKNGRGIIIWHDYSWVWGDVARAINRLYKYDKRFSGIVHIKDTSLVCYLNP